jgi:hypothetical protein
MCDVRVSTYVAEDVAVEEHVHVGETGEPKGWLYLNERHDVALWGSPPGLRRLAAALVLLAERAEHVGLLRQATTASRDELAGQIELLGVRGS